MEAIELFSAENSELPFFNLTYNRLIEQHNALALPDLPYRKSSLFSPDRPESWTLGWDLFAQQEIALPLQSVTLDQRAIQNRSFQASSNGLASGNHLLEAIVSGTCEVIERDAIACHEYAARHATFPNIRLASIPYPSVQELCQRLASAEIKLALTDCTNDTNVPVFMAKIYDQKFPRMSPIKGCGAHLDPEIAMLRAITEAIQGRAVTIAGSRDDIFPPSFEMSRNATPLPHFPEEKDYPSQRAATTESLEGDLHLLMEKLKQAGIQHLIVCDLTHNSAIPVVRIVIPQLEGLYSPIFAPGPRAKKFAARQQKNRISEPLVGLHLPAGGLA
jgi:ribosomal protein S12 methylthiotransferase accessory factor